MGASRLTFSTPSFAQVMSSKQQKEIQEAIAKADRAIANLEADLDDSDDDADSGKAMADMLAASSSYSLTILVVSGTKLVAKDRNGKSDPFVIVRHTKQKLLGNGTETVKAGKTPTIQKTLEPVWKSMLVLMVDSKSDTLCFEVWDEDKLGKDFMGQAVVPVPAKDCEKADYHLELKPRDGKNDKVSGSIWVKMYPCS